MALIFSVPIGLSLFAIIGRLLGRINNAKQRAVSLIDSLQRMYLRASECRLRISAISIRWKESSSAKGRKSTALVLAEFSILFGDQQTDDIPATPHDQLYADNRVAGNT